MAVVCPTEAPEWLAKLPPTERAEWDLRGEELDRDEQARDAERTMARPSWPALARTIRSLGGIDGLGQIAAEDIPAELRRGRDRRGRLLPLHAAVPYDELPLHMVGAGFPEFADLDGDGALQVLWAAWHEHQRHTAGPRTDVVPVTAPPMVGPLAAALAPRPAALDVAPLPEPDAGDAETYGLLDAFGLVEPRPIRPAPRVELTGADHSWRERQRRARPMSARERDRWELLELERAADELARERAEQRARLHVVRPEPRAQAGQRTDVAPSHRARAVFVAAILAAFAWSAAGIVALAASIAGADVPGIVWPLALTPTAAAGGLLPALLRPARDVRDPADTAAEPARRRAA